MSIPLRENIFKGQSNIRTVATVTHKQPNNQPTNHTIIEPSRFSNQWLDWGVWQFWSPSPPQLLHSLLKGLLQYILKQSPQYTVHYNTAYHTAHFRALNSPLHQHSPTQFTTSYYSVPHSSLYSSTQFITPKSATQFTTLQPTKQIIIQLKKKKLTPRQCTIQMTKIQPTRQLTIQLHTAHYKILQFQLSRRWMRLYLGQAKMPKSPRQSIFREIPLGRAQCNVQSQCDILKVQSSLVQSSVQLQGLFTPGMSLEFRAMHKGRAKLTTKEMCGNSWSVDKNFQLCMS